MSSKKKKKKVSTQEEAQAKKKSNVADAAFKKKVTIINGCILLAFIIGVGCFIFFSWYGNESYNNKFEAEKAAAKEAAQIKDSDADVIDIELTDKNYYDWIVEIDSSYMEEKAANYKSYDGDTIHLQAMIREKKFEGGNVEYWLYRYYYLDDGKVHSHSEEESVDEATYRHEITVRVEFDGEAPADGTWVDVVGTVSKAKYNLSSIKNAKLTVMDKPGNEYVD